MMGGNAHLMLWKDGIFWSFFSIIFYGLTIGRNDGEANLSSVFIGVFVSNQQRNVGKTMDLGSKSSWNKKQICVVKGAKTPKPTFW